MAALLVSGKFPASAHIGYITRLTFTALRRWRLSVAMVLSEEGRVNQHIE
jgi:hypothetical protein